MRSAESRPDVRVTPTRLGLPYLIFNECSELPINIRRKARKVMYGERVSGGNDATRRSLRASRRQTTGASSRFVCRGVLIDASNEITAGQRMALDLRNFNCVSRHRCASPAARGIIYTRALPFRCRRAFGYLNSARSQASSRRESRWCCFISAGNKTVSDTAASSS